MGKPVKFQKSQNDERRKRKQLFLNSSFSVKTHSVSEIVICDSDGFASVGFNLVGILFGPNRADLGDEIKKRQEQKLLKKKKKKKKVVKKKKKKKKKKKS